ncbi:MAG: FecR family protein [Spirochaetaceae bacterium]|jgi:hypothetical protein|nr:FecR family protein [Spirochaetaceae bacterium]
MNAKTPRSGINRSRKKFGFTHNDFIVSIVCVAGAIFAFLFFWRDLNGTLTRVNEPYIGIVRYKYKVAQRRFSDRLVWDMLKQDTPVYAGDRIHTTALSEAEITFRRGETLTLDENCLVQIFETADGTRIELSAGKIDFSTGDKGAVLHLVQSGAEVIISAGSVVSANSNPAGKAEIQVSKGIAEFVTKDGERHEASAGGAMALSKSGVAENLPIISLITPTPNQTLVSSGGAAPVDFMWMTQNFTAAHRVRLEISEDRHFSRIIEKSTENGTRRSINLEPGIYWWRAYPVTENTDAENTAPNSPAESFAHKFTVVAPAKPELLAPENGAVFSYRNKNPAVQFSWRTGAAVKPGEAPPRWLLTVAGNAEFNNPEIIQTLSGQNFTADNLEAGRWYWRVTAIFTDTDEGISAPSETFIFTIERTSAASLNPVDLKLPADGAFVNIEDSAKSVNFIWREEAEAESYRISFSRDADFTNNVLTRNTNESRFNFSARETALPPGIYFWRVTWKDADGIEAPPSQARQFTAREGDIVFEPVSPADGWKTDESALAASRFTWRTNFGAKGRLQAAAAPSFDALLTEIPAGGGTGALAGAARTESASGLNLPPGIYYWRIMAAANDGNTMQTAPRRFEVTRPKRLTAENPPSGAELNGTETLLNPPVLVWSGESAVLSSRLVLSRSPDMEAGTPLISIENPGRSVQTPALQPGIYYWTVKAQAPGGADISFAAPASFTVLPPSLLPAAVLTAPNEGASLTANELRDSRRIGFSWRAVRGANAYILSIYRLSDRTRNAPVFTAAPVSSPAYNFTNLERLEAGGFVWQVEAVSLGVNNRIEQHGTPSSRRFNINISIPEAKRYPDEETYGLDE